MKYHCITLVIIQTSITWTLDYPNLGSSGSESSNTSLYNTGHKQDLYYLDPGVFQIWMNSFFLSLFLPSFLFLTSASSQLSIVQCKLSRYHCSVCKFEKCNKDGTKHNISLLMGANEK